MTPGTSLTDDGEDKDINPERTQFMAAPTALPGPGRSASTGSAPGPVTGRPEFHPRA